MTVMTRRTDLPCGVFNDSSHRLPICHPQFWGMRHTRAEAWGHFRKSLCWAEGFLTHARIMTTGPGGTPTFRGVWLTCHMEVDNHLLVRGLLVCIFVLAPANDFNSTLTVPSNDSTAVASHRRIIWILWLWPRS
jgi:hypothetical protein